ncbi:alpha/beta hydrolase [uncultured Methanobrevibacter sp.]|uniref:alpha/beta hydrolase n=1 Tax=uncultured Methanobrevibacter sp. TaxID=253161 RepID=UPI0025E70E0A|nr:alpha/beta hydrolase [uncultured Methanobrevibacter sp.]
MKKRYIAIIVILLLVVGYFIYYVNDYYHADDTSLSYINGSGNVSVSKVSNGLFIDGPGNDTALIFYPGAKIEYTSYLPLMNKLAENGVDAYLVEMPFNLAFLGTDSANEIINTTNYSHYIMSGHSLGGSMASSYASKHNVDGLVLLAAYPSEKVNVPVLSVYGSNDKILNLKTYNESKTLMGSNFTEHIIDGANHCQFANFGIMQGDGNASINSTQQQKETVDAIIDFINGIRKN